MPIHRFIFSALIVLTVLSLACGDESASRKAAPQQAATANPPLFRLLSAEQSGVKFANMLPENREMNILEYEYYYNGGGVAIGDVNNDGLSDFYITANLVASRLYLNQGNMRFQEVTKQTGTVSRPGWKTGVTMADVDGNGFLDIYVCRSGKMDPPGRANELFMNNGDGTFTESAAKMGLADEGYGTQAAFFDYDRDGDLDMFLLNHSIKSLITVNVTQMKQGRDPYTGDKLYRNDGGAFTEVGEQAGIFSNRIGFGLGLVISDLNRDGWPDIYVANDYTEHDYIYLNQGDGTFRESLKETVGHTANFAMGADIADINQDTWPDMVVLDMLPEENEGQKLLKGPDGYERYQLQLANGFYHQSMRNMLQISNGLSPDGQLTFSEVGQLAGISSTDWSWSPLIADFDNDGLRDLFITNGYVRASTDMDFLKYTYAAEQEKARKAGQELDMLRVLKLMSTLKRPNYAFQNQGNMRFAKRSAEWGLGRVSYSNGAAYGDLDNDGDLDLIVNNIGEPAFIYQNTCRERNAGHYLQVALEGPPGNTRGIGARIEARAGNNTWMAEAFPTRGFQSSMDPVLHLGLGAIAELEELRIIWPDGKVQSLPDPATNQRLIVRYENAGNAAPQNPAAKQMFASITNRAGIAFRHQENDFVDFKRDPLLPHQLSRFGPALAVGDVNGDDLEDIFLGGAAGQSSVLAIQQADGRFRETTTPFRGQVGSEAVGAAFFDAEGDGDLDLYVVNGGAAFSESDPRMQDVLYRNNGKGLFSADPGALPDMQSSGACVAAGDMDGDGDLDLFVGGRVLPGRYPYSPRSYLLENVGNGFKDVTESRAPELSAAGMVSDAAWVNFTGDSALDLLVVGEWMPVRLFENKSGKLAEYKAEGLAGSDGWWNRILIHDFDRDGDPDMVLGNRGLNGQIRASAQQPASIHAKDFDGNGTIDPITCYYIQGRSYPMHSRDELLDQLNFLKKKFVHYADYADATINEVFDAAQLQDAVRLEARTFASVYVENQGDGTFAMKPLPRVAQVSPVFGLAAADYNGDGFDDLLVSGNFFPARVEMGRYDASIGMLLIGDGEGNFESIAPGESGCFLPGDIRNMKNVQLSGGRQAVIAVRNDARPDMLILSP